MKKTSITQLIEQLEEQKEAIQIPTYQKGLEYAIQAAKLKLETERENIEDAFIDGCEVGVDFEKSQVHGILCEWPNSEQYYKETYG